MRTVLVLIVVVLIGAGGYYWYSQNMMATPVETGMNDPFGASNSNTNPPVTNPVTPAEPTGASTGTGATAGAVKEFKFTNSGLKFSPATMTVKKGDRVRITYTNGGGTHDFRVDGYDVGTQVLSNGAQETFEFVANEAGTFEFYCSVGNHRAQGMVGSLVVTN